MLRSLCLVVPGLQVCGQAFLWHMVRCLMSVLFMVGRGHESPDVMSFLMDLERQVINSKQPVARVSNCCPTYGRTKTKSDNNKNVPNGYQYERMRQDLLILTPSQEYGSHSSFPKLPTFRYAVYQRTLLDSSRYPAAQVSSPSRQPILPFQSYAGVHVERRHPGRQACLGRRAASVFSLRWGTLSGLPREMLV